MKNEKKLKSHQNKYMKKIKKTIIAILFLLLVPLLLGCSEDLIDRKIIITAEKEIIDNVIMGKEVNHEKIFMEYVKGGKVREVKLGDKIKLDFGTTAPDYLIIKEWILSDKGEIIYTDKIVSNHEYYDTGDGTYYFIIDEDLLAVISTEMDEVNGIYRGIRIVANWSFDRESYILVCKT
jgi:hypothetical protein